MKKSNTNAQSLSHLIWHDDWDTFEIAVRGYTLSIRIGEVAGTSIVTDTGYWHKTTRANDTMGVGIRNRHNQYVCLPNNTSSYVPVSNLAHIILAVEAHDWERVCLLCDEEVDEDKFPQKT